MNSREIINELAKNCVVEKFVKKYTEFVNNPYIEDLVQDIYISLMEKDASFIQNLYKKNELDFFIIKMIKNNLYSNTSPFYKKYQKFREITDSIEGDINYEEDN